ncbi:MAG: GGDEF domain-containing phosphodiesterase, partial [Pseudomonadota bacterium]
EQTQKRLMFLIAGVLLLVTLLIFRPLNQGLRRVHKRVLNAQNELEYLAFHDPATGLCNTAGLRQSRRLYTGIVLIRIRNMAAISNVLGATEECTFMEMFVDNIKPVFNDGEQIGRTGADEISVLCNQPAGQLCTTLFSQISARASRLVVNGTPVYVEIGMGCDSLNREDFNSTVANARLAERSFEPADKKIPQFELALREALETENHTADKLREALTYHEFKPHYQLKVNAGDWQPCGMEALCRWIKPQGQIIPPGEFIPVAERKGLIVEITWQLVAQVIDDQLEWQKHGLYTGPVAVNFAEAVLREPHFASRFNNAIQGLAHPGEILEMEITENVALSDSFGDINQSLEIVRNAGISIALDDFGTGFASLSSVVDLDIDVIKVDRSFVHDMMHNEKSRVVIEGILSICNTLDKKSVIEGVETDEQALALHQLGVDQIQGFLFHRPSPAASIGDTLIEWHTLRAA